MVTGGRVLQEFMMLSWVSMKVRVRKNVRMNLEDKKYKGYGIFPVMKTWVGGGPRVLQRQVTTVSMVNDDSERVIGPESGQGVHANEGEVDDGQAKGLSAAPGR